MSTTGNVILKYLKSNATLLALLGIGLFLGFADMIVNGQDAVFFTARNLSNLTNQVTVIGIIAVGMTAVILLGGIDLSVGSIVGLSAIVVTLLMQSGMNVWFAIAITIVVVGLGIGLWNGFFIAKYNIPPFIITLGMMTIARGLALKLSKGSSVPVTDPIFPAIGGNYIPVSISNIIFVVLVALFFFYIYESLQNKKKYNIQIEKTHVILDVITTLALISFFAFIFISYRGIPFPVAIFSIIVAIGIFILTNTKIGRRIYAVGGNEEAARLSGVNIFTTKLFVFSVVGVLSAVSGILVSSRLNGASPNLGNMYELDAIASVAIGGTSFSGGSGSIKGTVIGTLIIGVLNNGMSILGLSSFDQLIIKGLIITFAVWFDVVSRKVKK